MLRTFANRVEYLLAEGPPNWYYGLIATAAFLMIAAKIATIC